MSGKNFQGKIFFYCFDMHAFKFNIVVRLERLIKFLNIYFASVILAIDLNYECHTSETLQLQRNLAPKLIASICKKIFHATNQMDICI
jgi:hypothetical protein